ncbi:MULTISPECIES: bifunctional DNA-formamidopyrimidine glycosylase/DNA-(apurinic or apyrimidinic site) lyase [Deefgea]|uniref:Formamidopyrimidine-DNA glycosylase n=1 Tax=Deefgea chitinilytica TaxID=570276 RepID=A0ABS2CE74_9NEIS|nr:MULTISPECIES: bifunctional DNA-formamidopyrimidine glycosylase/DNA-(apurinic or apyrimidinic site) lyase [Deefgea]MBM5572445.1 bifunctional DNA-formamidopyrimidine glycosylase/DNA-(apurinic or apyrimidinic site) lyase [Deefgea chitinilytica]MBM9889681.1 bifunctional DNA-formamidopyrimidine glycosylase/DNA-(apurinic or apyrimidinic site) lyase [Deefgea sp. CFH1-16]
MPELPEVETTRRGIHDHLLNATVSELIVRNGRLRWPVPTDLPQLLAGKTIYSIARRAKYLLLGFEHGTLIIHLGMSGSLRILTEAFPAEKHDHLDLLLSNGKRLRYHDPRRFGSWLWCNTPINEHPLLKALGPEPLANDFDAPYFIAKLASRKTAIKQLIMDNAIVVGVGNIYASESLFRARINPTRSGSSLTESEINHLLTAIKETLNEAIAAGGSTLKDYVDSDGREGYFMINSYVYGRTEQPCRLCGTTIKTIRQGQRATFYCPQCQL